MTTVDTVQNFTNKVVVFLKLVLKQLKYNKTKNISKSEEIN